MPIKMSLDRKWQKLLSVVDYAFQPIVNIYTGKTFAVEALIRDYDKAGFSTIDSIFDTAFSENALYALDVALREIAIQKFSKLEFAQDIKLFYNIDNRTTMMPDFKPGHTRDLLHEMGYSSSCLCFELSEKHQSKLFAGVDNMLLNIYKQQGYRMAIDDFGVGYSGLQILYTSEPDFVKIDRFFIDGIHSSKKKQLFVKSIVEISQSLGIQTIAEGIESENDLNMCKKLGCNMVQGYFVQKPTKKVDKIAPTYKEVAALHESEKRGGKLLKNDLKQKVKKLVTVNENGNVEDIFSILKNSEEIGIVPIIRNDGSCLGIVKESDLKEYTYTPYGRSLIYNITRGSIKTLISECGNVDINDSLEKILKIYSHKQNSEGVVVLKNGKYFGFLTSRALLDIINEKTLLNARGQNPLTGLPGNIVINEYISSATMSNDTHVLVYFDLDNFKPFNDYYGFRNGDRVIKLLGNIIKKAQDNLCEDSVAGHIGGDDFFLGWEINCDCSYEKAFRLVHDILNKFSFDVESFYNKEDRDKGYIISKNRNAQEEKFGMMTVSAAMLLLTTKSQRKTDEESIALSYAKLKKAAKLIKSNSVVSASLL